jgi:GT2 family glycosyltransferase
MGYPEKVSVIILMHDNVPMTMQCLKSLSDAVAGLDHEVTVLDNGSTEDARPVLEYSNLFRHFNLVRSNQNLSFSAANNLMVSKTLGRWLLFLNNDVLLGRECIKNLVAPLLENERNGATGGKLLFPGETVVQHAGIGQMLWDHPSNYGVGASPEDPRIQERRDCFALTGAALCVDREVFKKIGGFDERYIWGTEDIDLCLKMRAAGWKAVYCPEAVAVHRESATLKSNKVCEKENNCRLYRQLWNPVLLPAEQKYIRALKKQMVRRVSVFGMGTAARGLARILSENGIEIAAFTSSDVKTTGDDFFGRPVLPLDQLRSVSYDRLIVASQFYFAVEPVVREMDPLHQPIYPLLN